MSHVRVVASTVALLALTACGGVAGPGGTDLGAATGPGDAVAGEPLYQNNCAQCHGTDLRGTDQGPPHLSEVYEPGHHADISFVLAVQRGVQPHHWNFGPMPAIPELDEQEIADIIAYVRERQREAGIE